MRLKGTNMPSKIYVVRDQVFDDSATNYTAKFMAKKYAKENDIRSEEIIELNNETQLAYYQLLCEKKSQGDITCLKVNSYYVLQDAYLNQVGDTISPLIVSVPFAYVDFDNHNHYELVVASIYDIDNSLVMTKLLLDKFLKELGGYLKLLYIDSDGTFKEWKLNDIVQVRIKLVKAEHKKMLAEQRKVRQLQQYDRLLRLRAEGKITEAQSKELYRLDEIYKGN